MSTLLEKANQILTEKETKILSENIKQGVTAFGVTGTLTTVNNQNKTVTENGTYTADQGYTGLGEVTVNVDSIPDGIFIQDQQPTKITQQAIWLKTRDTSIQTKTSDLIPDDYTFGKEGWTWAYFKQQHSSWLNEFDSCQYHILCKYGVYWGNSTSILDYVNVDNDTISVRMGVGGSWVGNNFKEKRDSGVSGSLSNSIPIWTDFNVYDTNGNLYHSSDASNIEDGIEVLINNIKYTIHINKINSWNKILDTSNANATSGDILTGKTAFVNNTKITGTMPNNGTINITPSTTSQTIPAGYTSGGTVSGDANLVQANIRSGVTIFGVEGNLEPDKPDQTKTVTPNGSTQVVEPDVGYELSSVTVNPIPLNIYHQTTEPTNKNGLWLKSNVDIDEVITDDNVTLSPYWNTEKMSDLSSIPYSFYYGGTAVIGINVYLFGGEGSSNKYKAYKYDTTTNTYTQLTYTPFNFYYGGVASVGTDVYLFGGNDASTTAYKYNTLTDTYTQLTDIPYQFYYCSAIAVGTNVYLFGGYYNKFTAYKYNTLTNTYTQLTNIPYSFYYGGVASVGTDVYLFGGNDVSTRAYKYNTLTDTYTQLTNIPYDFTYSSTIAVGTDVYLFGSGKSGYNTTAYKYNTLTDTYTQLTNIPYDFYGGGVSLVNHEIYLFGGRSYPTKVQVFTFPTKNYTNNSIVIEKGSSYETDLIPTNVTNGLPYKFNNFYYYTTTGGLDNTIEKYYGDGTQWNKIN